MSKRDLQERVVILEQQVERLSLSEKGQRRYKKVTSFGLTHNLAMATLYAEGLVDWNVAGKYIIREFGGYEL